MADWVGQTLPTGTVQEAWQAACWDGTYFHLFDDGSAFAPKALRSLTGAAGSWTQQDIPALNCKAASGFGTTVVAIGAGGNMVRSTDHGSNWTADTLPTANTWVSITNNGSRFVAVHSSGAGNAAAYSDDGGSTWTSVAIPTGSVNWRTVLWTGTHFVAIGYHGGTDRGVYSRSTDGITWGNHANLASVSYDPIWAANIGGTVVVVAHVPTFEFIRSTDHGSTWARTDTGVSVLNAGNTIDICATSTHFFVQGYDCSAALTSSDGLSWSSVGLPAATVYIIPGASAGNDTVALAASNYAASAAMTNGAPALPVSCAFFHFLFGGG